MQRLTHSPAPALGIFLEARRSTPPLRVGRRSRLAGPFKAVFSVAVVAVPRLLLVGGFTCLMQLAAGPTVAGAQTATDLTEARVRADLSDGGQIDGIVVDWADHSLSLRVSPDSVWSGEWFDIAAVHRHRERRRTMRGLGLGMVIGGLGTGLVTAIVLDPCEGTGFCVGPDSRTEGFVVGGLIGAALGGAAGLLVGSVVTTSSWEPLVVPGPATSVSFGVTFRASN